ncbi:hypothetical protein MYCTH_2122535 [Thermothelomyces thermophilus ATCC 42464]|uniref:Uncharacterized protein n=1 Tax=Thermothelomyces thermophilus (strain ATCC 42464 / BCRC 31852 / DSM 1799) TaxID=573729 RepID=G2Q4I7_THET4|nr:uncharacterized protein MYCTH_2122535 [Thermothelomyces thermophilus ATCC 42464]AEO53680.1 hypothetical protein MYCTH_2122535 [Thermothelomyces thermophilus ATCC 42464]
MVVCQLLLVSLKPGISVPAFLRTLSRAGATSAGHLLAFRPGKKEQYKQYGAEFARRVGSLHGGRVKLVGRVLAHGPGRRRWRRRIRGGGGGGRRLGRDRLITCTTRPSGTCEDYQEANRRYRLGALGDTFVFCCQEMDGDGELAAAAAIAKPGSSN